MWVGSPSCASYIYILLPTILLPVGGINWFAHWRRQPAEATLNYFIHQCRFAMLFAFCVLFFVLVYKMDSHFANMIREETEKEVENYTWKTATPSLRFLPIQNYIHTLSVNDWFVPLIERTLLADCWFLLQFLLLLDDVNVFECLCFCSWMELRMMMLEDTMIGLGFIRFDMWMEIKNMHSFVDMVIQKGSI